MATFRTFVLTAAILMLYLVMRVRGEPFAVGEQPVDPPCGAGRRRLNAEGGVERRGTGRDAAPATWRPTVDPSTLPRALAAAARAASSA